MPHTIHQGARLAMSGGVAQLAAASHAPHCAWCLRRRWRPRAKVRAGLACSLRVDAAIGRGEQVGDALHDAIRHCLPECPGGLGAPQI